MMINFFFLCILSFSLCAAETWTPEDALQLKEIRQIAISPDGSLIAYEVLSADAVLGKWNSTLQINIKGQSQPKTCQLEEFLPYSMAWSAHSDFLYYIAKKEGRSQLHRLAVKNGITECLIDTKDKILMIQPAPCNQKAALLLQKRPPSDDVFTIVDQSAPMTQLYLFDIASRHLMPLTDDSLNVGSFQWSPNGEEIVFDHQESSLPEDRVHHSKISKINIATKAITSLVSTNRSNFNPRYSPDGCWIAYMVSPGTWEQTYFINVIDSLGKKEIRLAVTPDEQATIVGWLADNTSILVTEYYKTAQRLYCLSMQSEKIVEVSPPDMLTLNPSLSTQTGTVAFRSESPERPCEVYISSLKSFDPVQVSHIQTLTSFPKLRTEIIQWKSSDGLSIEGILTYPLDANLKAPYPLLVMSKNHGSLFLNTYGGGMHNAKTPYSLAVFASEGYAVLRPFFRGSFGYGRKFRNAIIGDWGGADLEDILSGIDYLVERGIADPSRLGMFGWSYGGFMTANAITKTNRFKAVSIGEAITNFISFTGTTNVPKFLPYYMGGALLGKSEQVGE